MLTDDITPGAVVKVPKGTDTARPSTAYLLHVRDVRAFASGAVEVTGEVRRLDGTPTTLRFKTRSLVVRPERLEAARVRPADLAPTPCGIRQVLRDAGFRRSAELPQRALRDRHREGFRVIEHPAAASAVLVRWLPDSDQAAAPAAAGAMLARYAQAIQASGWHVEPGPDDLTVTAAAAARVRPADPAAARPASTGEHHG